MIINSCDAFDATMLCTLLGQIGSLAYSFYEINNIISHLADHTATDHLITLLNILHDTFFSICAVSIEERFLSTAKRGALKLRIHR